MNAKKNIKPGGARLRKNRNKFVALTGDPDQPMSSASRPPKKSMDRITSDLKPVVDWFMSQEESHARFAWSLRDSLDELLDGERTGRWCYQHLKKTEKTHLGTSIEINFTKEFDLADGKDLDWNIAGRGVTLPVIANGRLYVRFDNQLFCFDISRNVVKEQTGASLVRHLPPKLDPSLVDKRLPVPIYLPTPSDVVTRMLREAELKPGHSNCREWHF